MIDYKMFTIEVTESKTNGSQNLVFDHPIDLETSPQAWIRFDPSHTDVTGTPTVRRDETHHSRAIVSYNLDTPGGSYTLTVLVVVGQKLG